MNAEDSWIKQDKQIITKAEFHKQYLQIMYRRMKRKADEEFEKYINSVDENKFDNICEKEFKLGDILEIVNVPTCNIKEIKNGKYPFITATMFNNGITTYCDHFTYDATDEPVITMSQAGTQAGYCFVQNCKFATNNHVFIFKLLEGFKYVIPKIDKLSDYITIQLTSK